MQRLKKWAAAACCLALAGALAGCGAAPSAPEDGKVRVVASLFPQYDFTRQIAGELAEVTLLLPPGVESHSFEPAPADILKIDGADLFVYTGAAMEPWAERLAGSLTGEVKVVDVSANIPLDAEEDGDGHDHGGVDPHIWTSPQNAKRMVDNLTAALAEADPAHAGTYRTNAAAYKERLDALDAELRELVEHAARREIVFGGRFALHYFVKEYGLDYLAAFDSCSHETEPSARAVAGIVDEIEGKGIPVIYYEELADPKVARAIAEETGAEPLLLHSCHNVSRQELEEGATYLSLMEQNVQNLREGLY